MVVKDNRYFFSNVEDLFDKNKLTELRELFIKSAKDNNTPDKVLTERELKALERGESSDKMRMQDAWYSVWTSPSGNKNLAELFDPYTYVTFPVQVRHVRQANHKVPWHQDIGYMRVLKDKGHQQVITCFIPIEPEPYTCTTVEFADDEIAKTEISHENLDGFGAGLNGDNFKNKIHYNQKLGDALVFGDFALHRTYTPEGWNVERRSLEFRLIKPEHRLANKDYFDIKLGKFIKTNENKDIING